MPSFECTWLKIKEGETKGIPKKHPGIPQSFLAYFIKKRMHDICMVVNARNILEWPVLSVNLQLSAAKLQK